MIQLCLGLVFCFGEVYLEQVKVEKVLTCTEYRIARQVTYFYTAHLCRNGLFRTSRQDIKFHLFRKELKDPLEGGFCQPSCQNQRQCNKKTNMKFFAVRKITSLV